MLPALTSTRMSLRSVPFLWSRRCKKLTLARSVSNTTTTGRHAMTPLYFPCCMFPCVFFHFFFYSIVHILQIHLYALAAKNYLVRQSSYHCMLNPMACFPISFAGLFYFISSCLLPSFFILSVHILQLHLSVLGANQNC